MAAIIGMASGYPRIVPVGREYRPGLVVKEVGATHAVLADAGRETRLELNGSRSTVSSQPSPAPAPPPAPGLAGMDAPALRLGLRPQKANGRITGFELKAGADLPVLHRAGLRPGDVILAVNGQAFESEEKLLELPREIAGSYVAEFEVERAGDRIKLSLPVNPTSPASK
jgi:general secretion pathway protein C